MKPTIKQKALRQTPRLYKDRGLATASMLFAAMLPFDSPLAFEHNYSFSFNWVSPSGHASEISFSLAPSRVQTAILGEKDTVSPRLIFSRVMAEAELLARDMATANAMVDIDYNLDDATWGSKIAYTPGHEDEARAQSLKISNFVMDVYSQISKVSYFKLEGHKMSADYSSIISDYHDVFQVIDLAFSPLDRDKSEAQKINSRLSFLQGITYDNLASDSMGFYTPIRMLAERRGDCESKQIMLAGLLKILNQNRDIYLVSLPNEEHILLALEGGQGLGPGDLFHNGKNFIVLDGTGPSSPMVEQSESLIEQFNILSAKTIWEKI